MKKVILGVSIAVISLMAVDYSQMTMEELSTLRGTISVEERDAFRAEMQSRMQAMTLEERQVYRAERGNIKGQGLRDGSGKNRINKGSEYKGQGIKQRLRDGSGAGRMNQGAGGQGKGKGRQ
jgi:hypothetical protein